MNVYLLAALCILGWMTLLFVVAHFKKDNSIADIGWGLGFIIVTWVTLEYSHTNYGKQRLLIFWYWCGA